MEERKARKANARASSLHSDGAVDIDSSRRLMEEKFELQDDLDPRQRDQLQLL